MLSQEILKKLIDSGMELSYNSLIYGDNLVRHISQPSLSELIEACGEELQYVAKDRTGKEIKWGACTQADLCGVGKSIEQAVAELYLILNAA